ncbi:TetR family transcriptional regulator [Pimelobacter simplex]|uniref:Regulation of the polyketide synthase operon (Pks) n=1 Tax=Nocardioides simplex TaxID=2045 RepID=A0A0A1DVB0_NOCSI|nr:TetR family transcriptional regulator C-terminal domain-containing protein [Pimelobacter simplex]AIY19385.1 regulation of the polyketide synthase operon (pks) [Pimelobacter simplex]MCG8149526.1 TetR family transcriptional regulator [Pimelobacter simplex]GEB16106.1 HTH-type transcriptional regulator PksA [Pimelobacter simplex]SFM17927.1 transcriptional regulator, TetR family [Pimelobacter simplex]
MPRTIDHEARRARIGEAVWRLVLREGVGAVSLRTVAAEAGLVLGSLRHSFPTKAELLAFAMGLAHERAAARVARHDAEPDPRRRVDGALHELLPLDDERTVEMRVHLALMAEGPRHAELTALSDAAHDAIAGLCRRCLHELREAGLVAGRRDLAREAVALHALVDGLALHAMQDAARRPAAVRALADHLDALATEPPRRP